MHTQEAGHLVHSPHLFRVDGRVQDDHTPRVEQEATQRLNPLALKLLVNLVDTHLVQEDFVVAPEICPADTSEPNKRTTWKTRAPPESTIDAVSAACRSCSSAAESGNHPKELTTHSNSGREVAPKVRALRKLYCSDTANHFRLRPTLQLCETKATQVVRRSRQQISGL